MGGVSVSFLSFGCAVCFGDPNSLSTKGVLLGVFFLLATVAGVLAAIGYTAFVWGRRAKELRRSV
jgi:hypothetical protein